MGKTHYRIDLILEGPRGKVGVEYDGRPTHTDPEAVARDKMRINDLQYLLKSPVVVVTYEQLRSYQQRLRLMGKLASWTGHRLPEMTPQFYEAQRVLTNELFNFDGIRW